MNKRRRCFEFAIRKLLRAPFLTDRRSTSSFQGASLINRGGCTSRKWRGKGAVEEHTCLSARGPLPHKTLCTIPIYRSSQQQQYGCHCLSPPGRVLAQPLSVTPSQSLSSLRYLIIRQFLALATCCSRVLCLPDYRASLKSPSKVCLPGYL